MTVAIPGPNETGPRVAQAVRQLADGGTNTRGSVTLAAGQTTTVVPDARAAEGVVVFLSPRSANAASANAWVSATGGKQFTLSHPTAAAGCTFDYEIRR